MKIAFLGNLASIHSIRWTKGLVEAGLDVCAMSSHPPIEALDPRVSHHHLRHTAPLGYFLNTPALRRLLAEMEPDLLHCHFASGYGTLASLSGFHPRVISVWGSDVYDFPRRSPFHRWLLGRTLRSAEVVTSTSSAMAQEARRRFSIAPEVVPFGVDTEVFGPTERSGSGEKVRIGTVRTLHPRYGVDILIKAYARILRGEQIDGRELADLSVVGDGPQRGELEDLALELGVRDRVEFTGRVAHGDVPVQLNKLDIFVAPSRAESFGVAVLEASACELPVVVSNVGGLPEVVDDGTTGLTVNSENVEELVQALRRLIQTAALRKRLGKAGREKVLRDYQWHTCVQKMLDLYTSVIERGKSEINSTG